jgi:hypothetical protein
VLFSSLVTSVVSSLVSNPFDAIYSHMVASPGVSVAEICSQIGFTGTPSQ